MKSRKGLKWLAYLATAVMLFCLAPDLTALAASRGECVTATGVYPSHLWSSWMTEREATCTERGLRVRICQRCGENQWEETPAAHKWGSWRTEKEATCKDTGVKVRTCTRCGKAERESIPKTTHPYGPWSVTKAPTCLSEGEETRKCTVCGLIHTRAIPADPEAHAFGEWQTVKESTATQPGLMRRTCALCGATQEEIIPAGEETGPVEVSPGKEKGICAIILTGEGSVTEDGKGKVALLISNVGEEDLTHVCLDVQLPGEDGIFYMERLIEPSDDVLAPGDLIPCDFTYLPGEETVVFTFVAAAESVNGGGFCSAVYVYEESQGSTPRSLLLPEPIEVTKAVVSMPPAGQEKYREGDEVIYVITVKNNLGYAVEGTIYDRVEGYKDLEIASVALAGGESFGINYLYYVRAEDVTAGSVTDTAVFKGEVSDPGAVGVSGPVEGESEPVTVLVGGEDELTILKEEISHSADPNGYVLNETVKFRITVHNGYDYPVTLDLWDLVSSLSDPTNLGTVTLGPGEDWVVEYTYNVRDDDVGMGFFDNDAYADVYLYGGRMGTREMVTIWSNTVRITVIDPRKPTPKPAQDTMCRRVLTAYGSEGGIYECTFCDTHLAVEQKVRGLGAAEAKATWVAAVNGLYDDLAAKYPGRTAQLAENDRTLFFAQLDLYEKMLTAAYGADTASEMVLDELRDRCIDLCYALHTVPKARTDSVLRLSPTLKTSGVLPDACVRTRRKMNSGFTLTETLCADHAYISYAPDTASPDAEDFAWTRRLWEAALTNETSVFRGSLPASAKGTASDALKEFLAWTEARGELLAALYGSDAVAQEVLVFTVRGRTMDLERNKP